MIRAHPGGRRVRIARRDVLALGGGVLALALITAVDAANGGELVPTSAVVVAPLLVATLAAPLTTAMTGVLATGVALWLTRDTGTWSDSTSARLATVVIASATAVLLAQLRSRRDDRLASGRAALATARGELLSSRVLAGASAVLSGLGDPLAVDDDTDLTRLGEGLCRLLAAEATSAARFVGVRAAGGLLTLAGSTADEPFDSGDPWPIERVRDLAGLRSGTRLCTQTPDGARWISVPIRTGTETPALLAVRLDDGAATDTVTETLANVAQRAATTVEGRRLARRQDRARRRLETLARIDDEARRGDTVDLLDRLPDLCVPAWAESASTWSASGGALRLHASAAHGDLGEPLAARVRALDPGRLPAPVTRAVELAAHSDATELPEGVDVRRPDGAMADALGRPVPTSSIVVPLGDGAGSGAALWVVQPLGTRRFDVDDVIFARELAQRISGIWAEVALRRTLDATRLELLERLRARHREAARLAEYSASLAAAVDEAEVGQAVVREALRTFGAVGAVLVVLEDDGLGLRIAATRGRGDSVAERGRISMGERGPLVDAIGTRRPVLLGGSYALRDRYPERPDLHGAPGIEATLALPLIAGEMVLGALELQFGSPEPFEAEPDRNEHLRAFTDQAAVALERALLFERERRNRDRAERLRVASDALARATTRWDVVRAVVEDGVNALGAVAGALAVVGEDGATVHVLDDAGYEHQIPESWRAFPLALETPAGAAIREATSVYLVDLEAISAEYPQVALEAGRNGHAALAAVPLSAGGEVLGVLVFSWDRAQNFDLDERAAIEGYAHLCSQALHRAMRGDLEHEISDTLQRALLPAQIQDGAGYSVTSVYQPATQGLSIGGDWYDAIALDDDCLVLVVGDVVGQGVRAAAAMGQVRAAVRALSAQLGPAAMLEQLDLLVEHVPDAHMTTLAVLSVDLAAGAIEYSLAGHCPPLLFLDGAAQWLEDGRGTPLGPMAGRARSQGVVRFAGEARLLLYTDGLVERRGESLDDGLARLAEVFGAMHAREVGETAHAVIEALVDPGNQGDDVAVLCAQLTPVSHGALRVTAPAVASELAGLRGELRGWLRLQHVDDETIGEVVLAVGEALANAVEHAYLGTPVGDVSLSARRVANELSVTVSDAGQWRVWAPAADRGRGSAIIRSLVDEVTIDRAPTGTQVTLRRQLLTPVGK